MSPESKLADYAKHIHLQDEDVEYILSLLQESRGLGSLAGAEAEREACARLVESAADAHDLHEIARRIRRRGDMAWEE